MNGLYTGLKFTGLAVRVASGLAASISKDAEAAMARSRSTQQEQRNTAEQVSITLLDVAQYILLMTDAMIFFTRGN